MSGKENKNSIGGMNKAKIYFFRKTKKTDKIKKLKKSQINNLGKGKYKNTAEIKQRVL